ncbi:helicase HerA domain-containing protein [Halobaculum sp. EA56]|uniref:ATP-binding protein n=1 Tax=Halobaculum sp. EA56 TaxID=3421648 RepID=UPI003EBE6559
MSDETITVADVSDGTGGESGLSAGTPISLPVVEILTGRGFITGKSGSGKSNTASVVIEKLLDGGYPCLIVDSDGEYYGLKEEYEILHAGADDECDIQVSAEHAEKLAALALEENVPIILDVSGYLDEDEASELIRETARQLFAKEKKLKKPFLMLVEECHEYIPEGAGMDKTGKTLIKIGKRGRKHGLGIVGISQRPADVKKDFITQCDWLCWHRLTWDNDTKVVSRILGSDYGEAIEDMDDGEAFLMTDWAESIRRVQFRRKQTFDAGATPGLDDFERPDLKSVSGDLVSELQSITDERKRTESELADLRQELDKKKQRITQLERELEEARDMSEMADTFAQALLQKAEAPYRGGSGRSRGRDPAGAAAGAHDGSAPEPQRRDGDAAFGGEPPQDQSELHDYEEPGSAPGDGTGAGGDAGTADATGGGGEPAESGGTESDDGTAAAVAAANGSVTSNDAASANGSTPAGDGDAGANGAATSGATADGTATDGAADAGDGDAGASHERVRSAVPPTDGVDISPARSRSGFAGHEDAAAFLEGDELRHREAVVAGFVRAVESLEAVTRGMLAAYRDAGRATPIEAHLAANGSGDRRYAYARNKVLRRAGFVEHRSEGEYAYALPRLVRRVYGDHADEQELVEVVAEVEARAGLDGEPSP